MSALPEPRPSAGTPSRRRAGPRRSPSSQPRVLIYAPGASESRPALALAAELARARQPRVLVVTEALAQVPLTGASVEWARLPSLRHANPERPLALEHLRSQRRRNLSTLFDRFRPGLLIATGTELAPHQELHELLERAVALGSATVLAAPGPHARRCLSEPPDGAGGNCRICQELLSAALSHLQERASS